MSVQNFPSCEINLGTTTEKHLWGAQNYRNKSCKKHSFVMKYGTHGYEVLGGNIINQNTFFCMLDIANPVNYRFPA